MNVYSVLTKIIFEILIKNMRKLLKLIFALAFITMIFPHTGHSAITLRLKEIPDDSTYRTIDTENSPIFSAFIKATRNGSPFVITKANIIIQEAERASIPMEVNEPDAEGWQKVSWYSRMRGYLRLSVIRFIIFDKNEYGYIHGSGPYAELPRLRIYTLGHNILNEVNFGKIAPGDTGFVGMKVFAITAIMKDKREQLIRVDSVKMYESEFSFEWKGSIFDRGTQPPVDIFSPTAYPVYMYYHPQDQEFHQDKFTVFYEGGLKEEIRLKGNEYKFDDKTFLQLNKPQGGETLIPCSTYRLKWEGNIVEVPTIIEFSTDNGNTWEKIAQVKDTVYDWKVPVLESEDCSIRIRQDFVNTSQKSLTVNDVPMSKVTYSKDSRKMLAVNEAGQIYEWNLDILERIGPYLIENINFPSNIVTPYGITYLDGSERFAVVYRSSVDNKNHISYFTSGSFNSDNDLVLDADFKLMNADFDNNRTMFALIPELGSQVQIHSLEDGSFIRNLDFHAPVTSLTFNKLEPEFFVTLYDGASRIISSEDFKVIKEFDFSDLPIILKSDMSPNGKYIALGCKQPTTSIITGNMADVHVVDIETGMIILTRQNAASDPAGLAFSPSSNILMIGSNYTPQLTLWDLKTNTVGGQMGSGNTKLNDFSFAPNGSSLIMADNSADNLVIKYFTFPESFTSERFRVVLPEFTVEDIEIEAKYFATRTEHEFPVSFCNVGEVPFAIENGWLEVGKSFALRDPLYRDTLYPGECAEINLIYTPLDTGVIEDALHIITCADNYRIPITSYGIPRNIDFLSQNFDFGELCIGEVIEKEIVLATNNDPVPLKINRISTVPPFYLLTDVQDTVLQPGESITVRIQYSPFRLGDMVSAIKIFHSDQEFLIPFTELSGRGVGVDVSLSATSILFIPEITERTITVTNKMENSISISDYKVEPEGAFQIVEPLPINMQALASQEITLRATGLDYNMATITLIFDPCHTERQFFIRPYSAQSLIFVNDVEADPKSEVEIPIEFSNYENGAYKGERFFEAEITLNPRIFFPESISTDYGSAELTKNQVLNDRRIIGFRVDGNFPDKGTIARIKGVPGLAESDTSMINFMEDARYWGISTTTSTQQGVFRLINLCGDRRILQQGISIDNISPTPADDEVNIIFSSAVSGRGQYEVYDDLGNLIEKIEINLREGRNELSLITTDYSPGSYKIIIRYSGLFGIGKMIIIK
jgi:WD40 repeat protein